MLVDASLLVSETEDMKIVRLVDQALNRVLIVVFTNERTSAIAILAS
jgi:hypothetical protein